VEAANSGHPGLPMGMADAATTLFSKFLKFDPANPKWPDRDRFVLSRSRLDAALFAALSHGLWRHLHRRHQAVPPVGKPVRRASRIWTPCRNRNDDGAARPGHRH